MMYSILETVKIIQSRLEQAQGIWTPKGWVVEKDLDLGNLGIHQLPKLKYVRGSFYCDRNNLTSLEGSPEEVGGNFICVDNKLTSLEGGPKRVSGNYSCRNNQLTSLSGFPQRIDGSFICSYNYLTSLRGCSPKIGGGFYCSNNKLTSLRYGPAVVGGSCYDVSKNRLSSLKGSPEYVNGNFLCYANNLRSLEGGPVQVVGDYDCRNNKLKSLKGKPVAIGKMFTYDWSYSLQKDLESGGDLMSLTSVTTNKAAELLGINQRTVRRMLDDGRLRGEKSENKWMVYTLSINEMLETRSDPSPQPTIEDLDSLEFIPLGQKGIESEEKCSGSCSSCSCNHEDQKMEQFRLQTIANIFNQEKPETKCDNTSLKTDIPTVILCYSGPLTLLEVTKLLQAKDCKVRMAQYLGI